VSGQGIAAPVPVVYVTVLGLTADDVVVRDAGTDPDVVRVEIGTVHLAGPLAVMAQVVARAADGLAAVEADRQGTDRCSGYGPDPEAEDGP
jgi:hypothetical protein